MEHTPVHILRYLGRTSNNNKMLINNSLCYFAIQVVYIQITITWDIWYIDDGFLVWIIPSMCLSHETVIWIVSQVLLYLLSSDFNSDFWFCIYYYYFIYIFCFTTCVLLYRSPTVTILYTTCLLLSIRLVPLYLTFWLAYS